MPVFWVNGSSVYTLAVGSRNKSQVRVVAMGGILVTANSADENEFLAGNGA